MKIREECEKVLKQNGELPSDISCNLIGSEFKIELTNETPIYTRQYPIPEIMKGKVREKVKEWSNNDWIEECTGQRNLWNLWIDPEGK